MFLLKINEKIALKQVELQDSDALFQLTDASRTYLKEWLPWLDHTRDVSDTRNFIRAAMRGHFDEASLNAIIIYEGKVAGIAGFNKIDRSNKTAYIGYWLGEQFQGNGIMTTVAGALTQYAFEHLSLNKVEIRAAVGNVKSRSIPQRLGYKHEATIRQAEWLYDHYVDHAVYGMLRAEWTK